MFWRVLYFNIAFSAAAVVSATILDAVAARLPIPFFIRFFIQIAALVFVMDEIYKYFVDDLTDADKHADARAAFFFAAPLAAASSPTLFAGLAKMAQRI